MLCFLIPNALSAVVSDRVAPIPPRGRVSSLATLFLGIAGIAFSEDMEIVVSASRIEEDARSSSSYVRVISPEVMARADNVPDALKTLPDISIITNAPGKAFISMGAFGDTFVR